MIGGKPNALNEPQVMGVQTTTCIYNTAIPLRIGARKAAGRVIWYGYFGPGNSGKKFKSSKKGITTYQSNLDLLLGFGPIWAIWSAWNNSNMLGFGKVGSTPLSDFSQMGTQTYHISGVTSASGTVNNLPGGYNLEFISAVSFTPDTANTATIDDYGDPLSPRTITETLTEEFLYNTYFNSGHPGTYAWRPGSWAFGKPLCNADTCTFPIGDDIGGANWTATFNEVVTGTITVYYGCTKANHDTPLAFIKYEFEPQLGEGNEYNGSLSSQQIIYPELSGCGGVGIDLGATGTAPELDVEVQGLYSLTKTGQVNCADTILDLILSGNIYFNNNDGTFDSLCFSHGLNFNLDPTRQSFVSGNAGNPGTYAWPVMATFPYVIAGNGVFQLLKDTPEFSLGTWQVGVAYTAGSIVFYSDSLGSGYFKAIQLTTGSPNPRNTSYWLPFTGSFSDGLTDVRNYCTANGIYMSLSLEQQRQCSEVLDEVCQVANCVAVWNGQNLDFYPYSEVSALGSGSLYTPRTASGPIVTFDYRHYEVEGNEAPVIVKQSGLQNVYNIVDINYSDRGDGGDGAAGYQSYQSNNVQICDAEHCQLYGPMNGTALAFDDYLCDANTATLVGWPIIKRQRFADPYTVMFKLPQHLATLLDPMDFITVVEPSLWGGPLQDNGVAISGSGQRDVRITSLEEDDKGVWSLECERFMYGMSAPSAPSVQGSSPNIPPQSGTGAGSVNTPYFFEPTAALGVALGINQNNSLCIAVSGSASNYGGCQVYVSTDGGSSYVLLGTVNGNPAMGQTYNSDYPPHTNPDNTNNLFVDLTESSGELQSFTSAQQNQLVSIALLDNSNAPGAGSGSGYSLTIPYEIIAYGTTALQTGNKYEATQPILRGQLGTVPADHPYTASITTGSTFVDLSPNSFRSIFKTQIPSGQIEGNVLYFKFPTFNLYGAALEDLSACTAYPYTVTGATNPGQNSQYTVSPSPCLTQGDPTLGSGNNDPTQVYFPALTVNFQSGAVSYSAQSATAFSLSAGGQTVYVCLYDPSHAGGSPTVDIQSTNAHATTPGYIYLGSITSAAWTGSPGSGTGGAAGGSSGGSGGTGGPQDGGNAFTFEVDGVII